MNKRRRPQGRDQEKGIALVAALLVTMLVSALLVGFTSQVVSDQKIRTADSDATQAFYAAHAGLEKLTSDLGTLFEGNYAASGAQIQALTGNPPALAGVSYLAPNGSSGYTIDFPTNVAGNPQAENRTIASGPFQGFIGLLTQFDMTVTARSTRNSEAQLARSLQLVAIPLFQFGIFSEMDLGYHAGPDFDFGGRAHTNGTLYLAAGGTLTLSDRVTARNEVIRTHLMNGYPSNSSWPGNVRIRRSPSAYRNLGLTEGSLVNTVGSSQNEPTWTNLSIGTYNGNIRNGRTGAKRLDLPLVADGSGTIELIRRPPVGEVTTSSVFQQRYFSMASLRILLSDTAANITGLPSVTGTAPIALGIAEPYVVNNAGLSPFGEAAAIADSRVPAATPLMGGYIKIDKQTAPGTWVDVTQEILNLGITGKNLQPGGCADPSANAVIRIQRVKDSTGCNTASVTATDFWPKTLYDTREAKRREDEPTGTATVYLGGVMHYIELDINNLRRWLTGAIGVSGTNALNVTGYTVYFSDRRGNRNAAGVETGEYGFEDFVNPASAAGTPNAALDTGEDVNGNATLETYGQTPVSSGVIWTGDMADGANPRPWTAVAASVAQGNPARFFRRALKLVNGRQGNIIAPGLTVASENPVYVQGDYNANGAFGDPHVACSIVADAVTLLSNAWSDRTSFTNPHYAGGRDATDTWYRAAVITGKGRAFPRPTAGSPPVNFGSDGGAHNFLRYLESWNGETAHYRGSLASLYFNRQGLGVFKDGSNTYDPPERDFRFDVDFLQPTLLPPRTPMFRDVNTLGFTRVLR